MAARLTGPLKDAGATAENAARDREELRVAILLARDAGETFDDIGGAAGLSRQRVQQIVAEPPPRLTKG
jgi:DNA-directed RNA polymerase sigma subunit (sigma70/sigma32)